MSDNVFSAINQESVRKHTFAITTHFAIAALLFLFGALIEFIGFILLPWAQSSIMGEATNVTGLQVILGELFANPALKLIAHSTPGLWPLATLVILLVVCLGLLLAFLYPRLRGVSWAATALVAMAGAFPVYLFLHNDIAWVFAGDGNSAFAYTAQANGGMGLYATLIGVAIIVIACLVGLAENIFHRR